jgi:hypothetical protein
MKSRSEGLVSMLVDGDARALAVVTLRKLAERIEADLNEELQAEADGSAKAMGVSKGSGHVH